MESSAAIPETFRLILQVFLAFGTPVAMLWLEPRVKLVRVISPVILCYVIGMIYGNLPFIKFSGSAALTICNITVGLGIPLLLFSVDIKAWLKLSGRTAKSFLVAMSAVIIASAASHFIFRSRLPESLPLAAMLTGVYIGITPNMAAIGSALKVAPETFVMVNAADMVVSFAYLIFILMIAPKILKKVLPPFGELDGRSDDGVDIYSKRIIPPAKDAAIALLIAGGIVGAAAIAGSFVTGYGKDAIVILILTTAACAASFFPKVRKLKGSYDAGQFLFLSFCVAIGFTTDFTKLFSSSGLILLFCGITVGLSVLLHLLAAIPLKIDPDTVVITSVAGIFGPHMIGPAVMAIKNKDVLFSGIVCSLIGIAAANYLGLALAWVLSWI